jgi:hypothetical protein
VQTIVNKIFSDLIEKDIAKEAHFYRSRGMIQEGAWHAFHLAGWLAMIGMLGLTGMWPAERVEGILLKTQESKAPRTAEVARPANKRLKRDPSKPIYKDEVAFELTLDEGYDGGGEATASECREGWNSHSSAGLLLLLLLLLLRREPGLEQLEKPVIRTSARVTVRHLKKFVGMKLAIPNLHDVRRPPLFFFFFVSVMR